MSNELAVRTAGVQLQTIDDVARVSRMFAESGFFTDAREAAQCGVKIMAGAAWGIDPFTAMTGIHIINNKPSVSAGLMAAAVKGHPKYDYRVRERSATACRVEFFERGESLGVSEYTIDMAQRAGLTNNPTWRKFPEAMLFARAMSAGVRTYCPDVFHATVYTPDELGAEVDGEGNVIDVPVSAPVVPVAAPAVEASAPKPNSEAQAAPEASEPVSEPMATPKQRAAIGKGIEANGLTKDQATAFFSWLFGRPVGGSAEFTKAEASRVIGWDEDAWQAALADYAVALEGGVPDEEPTWEGLGPA